MELLDEGRQLVEIVDPNKNNNDLCYTRKYVSWPGWNMPPAHRHREYQRELSKVMLNNAECAIEDINQSLIDQANKGAPIVLYTTIDTTLFEKDREIVNTFLDFWKNWPPCNAEWPIFVLLHIDYQEPRRWPFLSWLFFNQKDPKHFVRAVQNNIGNMQMDAYENRMIFSNIPELANIGRSEVMTWFHKYVSEFIKTKDHDVDITELERELYGLFKKPHDTFSMTELEKKLGCVLQKYI